ncbi:DUF4445 domain-containing protein [Vallitalea pronyensis]|uniref:DUF4445 domain-containing protein n=1 Tax=Vallitalea pronyensis TaxID=1348613 RepID=A0A8J8MIC4_9FIRM|nr:ASKHA domain-containing protein [Vallitalea pronyensis]QUI21982.1 DUF4445 domain-containing protein [Vallitalea pronyensis]
MKIKLEKTQNKKIVMDMMQCYEDSPNYSEYSQIYDDVIKETLEHISPVGYYTERDNEDYIDSSCEKVIFCIVSLGCYLDEKVKEYFADNDFLKGMMLNTIGDQMLFDNSSSLYNRLKKEYTRQGIHLTSRVEPGTCEIDIKFQKHILDVINEEENTDIDLTSGYMFSPGKTLSFYYGASANIEPSLIDHDCRKCSNTTCAFRKITLTIRQGQEVHELQVKKGVNLLNILRTHEFPIDAYCSGKKSCGKCKVKLLSEPMPLSDEEKKLLTDQDMAQGIILACFHHLYEDTTIEIKPKKTASKIQSDYHINATAQPKYTLLNVPGITESADNNKSATALINACLQHPYDYTLHGLKDLSHIKNLKKDMQLLCRDNQTILRVHDETIRAYGVGIDIGTTTVVITLIDLIHHQEIGIYKHVNPQAPYGADVISRINYAVKDPESIQTSLIRKEISSGIHTLLEKHHIASEDIVDITISGNTTMQYLLMGLNPYKLSISPFTTMDLSLQQYHTKELFEDKDLDCQVTLLPGISAYIGSDITSGFYYSDLLHQKGNVLFIDIGTNGEIALKTDHKILCAATAAGPAFEGANIKCGMGSIEGAICSITSDNDTLSYDVIGHSSPKGICGSALVDITAELLNNNHLDTTGKLVDSDKFVIYKDHDTEIALYQEDIRQLQLAKSAVAAGVSVLVKEAGLTFDQIDTLLLAGGFGSNLNVANAVTIGLIQKELIDKTRVIGNSSLGGSVNYMIEQNSDDIFDVIASKCHYIELSTNMVFNEEYIMNMYF